MVMAPPRNTKEELLIAIMKIKKQLAKAEKYPDNHRMQQFAGIAELNLEEYEEQLKRLGERYKGEYNDTT